MSRYDCVIIGGGPAGLAAAIYTGRARIRTGAETHEVSAGNVLFIPAGVPHSYEVLEAPFEFLCLVPNLKDEIKIVDRGGKQ